MIFGQAPRCNVQIAFVGDVVPVNDRSGLVAGDLHRDFFRYARPDQVSDAGTAEIMEQLRSLWPNLVPLRLPLGGDHSGPEADIRLGRAETPNALASVVVEKYLLAARVLHVSDGPLELQHFEEFSGQRHYARFFVLRLAGIEARLHSRCNSALLTMSGVTDW
jgi:hypothetical protein